MTIRTLIRAALPRSVACVLVLTALAACDKKEDAAPAAAQTKAEPAAKSGAPAAKSAAADTKSAAPADKPAPAAPAQGVKIVANFDEFNGVYDKSVAIVNNIGVEIALARDCPALTCEMFTEDGYNRNDEALLKACPKISFANVGFEGAKDLPVGEHKAEISLLGLAESSTNSMAHGKDDMATVKITERTPSAFVGSISYGTADSSNASGTFWAPICPHKD